VKGEEGLMNEGRVGGYGAWDKIWV